MPADIPLRCRCGRVRGLAVGVSPASSSRVVCYCDDCQAYARHLGTPGIVDAHGGTDILQVALSRVRITDGLDAVECVRLSEKGLLRWYAGCCRTPMGNTMSARVPFIGVVHSFRSLDDGSAPGVDVLGAPVGVWGRFAVGGPAPGAHDKAPVGFMVRVAVNLFGWWIRGEGRPSPFFDGRMGAPRVAPKVLGHAEREALRRPRDVAG